MQIEPANPVARNAIQSVIASRQGQKDHVDQLLMATGQILAKPQKTQAVLAKSIHGDGDGLAVRPKGLVAFELNCVRLSIARRITTKEECQSA